MDVYTHDLCDNANHRLKKLNLKNATKYEVIQQSADIDEEENHHIHLDTRQINILNINVVSQYV